jgi:transcriptional regulator with XRE-family HTH domain
MTEQPGTTRNLVKEVRLALGLSQEQMAHKLGCSQSTVWRCERTGTVPHDVAVVAALHSMAGRAGLEIEP